MKLSIIITVYNREKYIARCIESVLNQNLDDYEVIIINDGSTDNSHNIIKQYADKYKDRIKYIKKENGGVSSARNEGIKQANGEYITYIDSDDYAEQNCYKEIYELAKKNNYDIVMYDAKKVFADRTEYMEALEGIYQGKITKKEYILSMPCPWNKLIKKEIIQKADFCFPEKILYEDYAMIPTLVNVANNIFYYKKQVINYYMSEESIMRDNGFKEKYLDIFKASEILKENIDMSIYKEELEFIYWENLLVNFSLLFYKYNKFEYIDRIADIMQKEFPHWKKNKYIKKQSIKKKIYAILFFKKKYIILKKLQKLKHNILGGN